MIAPEDVGRFAADVLLSAPDKDSIYELEGPQTYTPADITHVFSGELGREVRVQHLEPPHWERALKDSGFSPDGIRNFIEMTEATIDGRTRPEGKGTLKAKGTTILQQYVRDQVSKEAVS